MIHRICSLLLALCLPLAAAVEWPLEQLYKRPQSFPAPSKSKFPSVKATFLQGLPWQGKETRIFCYYGLPAGATPDQPVPAMVLIHGGGGSAFPDWVKLWNDRGYAAIAMDTCGQISGLGYRDHSRHEFAGPMGWGGFDQTGLKAEDQWSYHAVAAVITAHSFLRTLPGVDAERVGLTGISWGGYLTCLVAGIDERFQCAIPVYGGGFLDENSTWLGPFKKLGPEKTATWIERWDPKNYLPRADLPFLWVTGTNDFAYPLDSHDKSVRRLPHPSRLSIPGNMPHGQPQGQSPAVIAAFADQELKKGPALPTITALQASDGSLSATYHTDQAITRAELLFTEDDGNWHKRQWQRQPARLDPASKQVSAPLPPKARACFLNLHDPRGFVISSRLHLP
ncbi:MAG: alpha/beta hydrolase family protein [Verrucomicrobiales bacterium]